MPVQGAGGSVPGRRFDARGQSSVIGVVLIVSITVMGVTGITLFGSSALSDAHMRSEVDAAEHAMTQLDSHFSLVALGSAERQGASVALRGGASLTVDGDRGWMNVSVYNRTSEEVDHVVLNTTLGAVTYENGGTTVAYQGGGVWKRTGNSGSVMVSPPEFHYRTRSGEDPTLTLPLVVLDGSGSISGEATVSKDKTISKFPNESNSDLTNPLQSGEINITVQSDYYEAWGAFFEGRTGGSVTYDHDRERVITTLKIAESASVVSGGAISGATEELVIHKNAEIDSYNSSVGPYTDGEANNSIVTSGSAQLKKNAKIKGDLTAGGDVILGTGAEVTGDTVSGADVPFPRAIDWLIDEQRVAIQENPSSSDDIDSDTYEFDDCSPCELTAGQYYFDEFNLDGEDLTLDTSDGDIEIVVNGTMDIEGSDVLIEGGGDNTTRFYIEDDFLPKNSNVSVPEDRSTRLWIYMNPDSTVDQFSQSEFVGVIYGPGRSTEEGVKIKMKNKVEIYGGLVGTLPDGIDQKQGVHFDEALATEDPLMGLDGDQPTVTYMHVTVNQVNVSSR